MSRNAVYSGVIAGAGLIALLFYPLYIVLPGRYVAGWPAGAPVFAYLCGAAAPLLLVGGGKMAAGRSRPASRRGGAFLGALAGLTAAVMAYAALGAAAAGVAGLGDILAPGSRPAGGDAQLASLQVGALLQITRLTYAVLWGMPLAGALLGAAGGWLRRPAARGGDTAGDGHIADVISSRLLLVTLLFFGLTAASTAALPGTSARAAVSIRLAAESDSLFAWPVGSSQALLLSIVAWKWWLNRRGQAARRPSLYLAAAAPLLALLFLVLLLGLAGDSESGLLFSPVVWLGGLIGLGLSAGALRRARSAPPAGTDKPVDLGGRANLPLLALGGGVTFGLPALLLLPLTLNLALGYLPALPLLANFGADFQPDLVPAWTAAGLVRRLFLAQALAAYGIFLIGALSLTLAVNNLAWLRRRPTS